MSHPLTQKIEKEIEDFLSRFYTEEIEISIYWQNFIKDYNLYIPQKNHLKYMDLLFEAYEYLKNVDYLFEVSLLPKLRSDIEELNILISQTIANRPDTKMLYNQYLAGSETFEYILDSKELYIYYDELIAIFSDDFEQKSYFFIEKLLHNLNIILNHKITMFEYLLWEEANKSYRVKNSIVFQNIHKLNTKNYIRYMLGNILSPYSIKYNHMKKILKEYT